MRDQDLKKKLVDLLEIERKLKNLGDERDVLRAALLLELDTRKVLRWEDQEAVVIVVEREGGERVALPALRAALGAEAEKFVVRGSASRFIKPDWK